MQAIDTALDLIRQRGSLRTPQLAAELGIGEGAVDAMLEAARADGRLTTCAVQVGERRSIEYRLAASGGKYNPLTATGTLRARPTERIEPTTPNAAPQAAPASTPGSAPAVAAPVNAGDAASSSERADQVALRTRPPLQHHQGETTVSVRDKVEAVLLEHGPMGTRALKARGIKDENLATICSSLVRHGVLRKLGGGSRSTIYGLPGQKAPAVDALERGAELGRKKKAGGAPKAKRAGGGVRCNAA